MTRNAANGKKEAKVRLGASTKRNESEVELVASQCCSQSAAEPQDSGGSDLSESDDSYPSGCECPDSLCNDADKVWSHAHRERRDGRIARNPAQFVRRLVYFLGVLRSPTEPVD